MEWVIFSYCVGFRKIYRYSYGRSGTGNRLKDNEIMLPALIKEDGTYEPDWDFMTSYIQSLKYANLL